MKGEYGEPWRVDGLACLLRFGRKNSGPWDDCDGDVPDDSDADRIVACVNAMDGLDPAQVRELVRLVGRLRESDQIQQSAMKSGDVATEIVMNAAVRSIQDSILAHARSMEGM